MLCYQRSLLLEVDIGDLFKFFFSLQTFDRTPNWLFFLKSLNLFLSSVVTQFWIHQDFLECCFISIIIHKNPKKN